MMIVVVIVVIIVILAILSYNNLVGRRNSVDNSISDLDTYLQKRLDMMSNEFELVAAALNHESDVYKEVTKLRSQNDELKEQYNNDNDKKNVVMYDKKLTNINKEYRIIYENYPNLTVSNTALKDAMEKNTLIENDINAARRNYNQNVINYRNAIQVFPNMLFAGMFGFKDNYELYKSDEEAKDRVKASDYLNKK